MRKIKPETVDKILKRTGTKIGFVKFTKLNGDVRDLWFQGKIARKLLVGGQPAYDPKKHRLTWVRDIFKQDNPVRSVKWDNVEFIRTSGKEYRLR